MRSSGAASRSTIRIGASSCSTTDSGRCSPSDPRGQSSSHATPIRSPVSGNLALFIDCELAATAVLDGEIVCFDRDSRGSTTDVRARRACFRRLRRARARRARSARASAVRANRARAEDSATRRSATFAVRALRRLLVCARDLEGIVAKWKGAP